MGGKRFRRIGFAVLVVAGSVLVVIMGQGAEAQAASLGWSVTTSPDQGGNSNILVGVSCVSATSCTAVGSYDNGSVYQTLVESWNGTSWSIVSSPNEGSSDGLSGVLCTSVTSCTAVGSYNNGSVDQTLVESWNGTSWSIVSSPNEGSDGDALSGVSCVSTSDCTAVGNYNNGSGPLTLVESWNGTAWSIVSSPSPGTNDVLQDVACMSATFCEAIGDYDNGSAGQETLIEGWNGSTWSQQASVSPATSGHPFDTNILSGVSCSSPTSCMTVGYYGLGAALAESWNGTAWSQVSIPNANNGSSLTNLNGVSCVASSGCVAVGTFFGSGNTQQTVVETWNTTSWSVTPSANQGTGHNDLIGVSCLSTDSCEAVGYDVVGSTDENLIEIDTPPPPIVSSVSPSTGFTTGGTVVTISGSGFTGATAVDFNGTPATNVSITNDGSLNVSSPAVGTAGVVDVTVTAPDGTSSTTPADQFTYTVQATPTVVPCNPSCSDSVATPLNGTAVTANATSGTGSSASVSLVVNTDTVGCPSGYDFPSAVSTLSTSGFAQGATVTITETVGNEPSTKGVKVCFEAAGASSGKFLRPCKAQHASAPCLQSLTEEAGNSGVMATLLVPASDPRFWTGGAPLGLKKFSPTKGAPGTKVTIKGKNLTGAVAVVMGGARATIESVSSSKLVFTVPASALTGPITVTAASGPAVSLKQFTVT
jgi:hypothetical protein